MAGLDLSDAEAVTRSAETTKITSRDPKDGGETRYYVNSHDATSDIRTETCGAAASAIAAIPSVRAALVDKQHSFRKAPGLVADGRDMGTVIFPDAQTKVFGLLPNASTYTMGHSLPATVVVPNPPVVVRRGEVSGDQLAARLVAEVRRVYADAGAIAS